MIRCGEVMLTGAPWISGMRALGYYEGVKFEHQVRGKSWEEAIDALLEDAAERARAVACNAILNFQIDVHPYRENGPVIAFRGTFSRQETLFAGVGFEL